MTASQIGLVAHLAADPRFIETIGAMANEEIIELTRTLRTHVADGNHREAAITEGRIQAFESLTEVITRERGYVRPQTVSP